jgi:hypothetical protein
LHFVNWLRSLRRSSREALSGANSEDIVFEGGNGDSLEAAVVVRGARYDLMGTWAEITWLTQRYGKKDSDWKLLLHSHCTHEGREIDTFELLLADGRPLTVFFDCTDSFGKWPP